MKELMKEYLKLFLALIVFFIVPNLFVILIRPLIANDGGNKYFILSIYDLFISLIQAVLIVVIYRKTFKEDLEKSKKTYQHSKIIGFLVDVLIGFAIFFVIKIASSMLSETLGNLFHIKDVTTDNQNTIEKLLKSFPLSMIISASILAPIIEETVFRRSIFNIIKNKRVYITVSGLIFGMMHVIDSNIVILAILLIGVVISIILSSNDVKINKILLSIASSIFIISLTMLYLFFEYKSFAAIVSLFEIKELIGGITYVAVGIYLAYVYVERENIYYNIGIHSLNNLFSVIVLLSMK